MDNLNENTGKGGVRIAIIGVLAILALFLLVETLAVAHGIGRETAPAANTITVTGEGQASVAPDVATITFGVMETATTVSAAQSAATDKTNAALAAVKGLGIDDKDVRTVSYTVYPQYEQKPCAPGIYCPQDTSRISGYQVSETVAVKVHDLDKAGDVLQALGTLGVQNISGPDLGLDNPSEGTDAARADAISDAKAKAEVLARQLGVHLGDIVSFNENGGGYPSPVMYKAADSVMSQSAGAAPAIPTGENEYSSSVSITYEIR